MPELSEREKLVEEVAVMVRDRVVDYHRCLFKEQLAMHTRREIKTQTGNTLRELLSPERITKMYAELGGEQAGQMHHPNCDGHFCHPECPVPAMCDYLGHPREIERIRAEGG